MKKLLLVFGAIALFSCQEEAPKDYVTFSGTITNQNSDSLMVYSRSFNKTIAVNADGTFSDTLKVTPGIYRFYDGTEGSTLFLENGYDMQMTLNTEEFDESIKYTGEGSHNNNFLAEKALLEEKLFDIDVSEMDLPALDSKMSSIESELNNFIASKTDLDSLLVSDTKKGIKSNITGSKNYLANSIKLRTDLPKGAPSPVFENYENHKGGTTSLADLKGKYVYIDVWATWCGPCKAEIPFLKEVENDYHGKNIEFVSVSIDQMKDHEKWIAMVNDKELGGIQVFADSDWSSKFVTDYYISGIPRFILVDDEGNIVSPDAPRPSNPKLRELLDELI